QHCQSRFCSNQALRGFVDGAVAAADGDNLGAVIDRLAGESRRVSCAISGQEQDVDSLAGEDARQSLYLSGIAPQRARRRVENQRNYFHLITYLTSKSLRNHGANKECLESGLERRVLSEKDRARPQSLSDRRRFLPTGDPG